MTSFKKISLEDCLRLTVELRFQLLLGRGLLEAFKQLQSRDVLKDHDFLIAEIIQRIESQGISEGFEVLIRKVRLEHLKTLFSILSDSQRSVSQLIESLAGYQEMLTQFVQLKEEQRSSEASSKYQAIVIVFLSFGLSLGLPIFFPSLFPSFFQLNAAPLFFFGLFVVFAGVYLMIRSHLGSLRRRSELLNQFFFCQKVRLRVDTGEGFVQAWNSSLLELSRLRDPEELKIDPQLQNTVKEFDQILPRLPPFVSDVFLRCYSAIDQVSLFPEQLKLAIDLEFERLVNEEKYRNKRRAVFSLIPVLLLIFPASCFLLLGPQFLKLLQELDRSGLG